MRHIAYNIRRCCPSADSTRCNPASAEEDYCEAITAVQKAMDKYEPSVIGYEGDHENPRIQLEPRGERGYIELKAVKAN